MSVLRFCPNDRHYMVGGLATGQVIIWRLQPADLGQQKNLSRQGPNDEEVAKVPTVAHKMMSMIDESHKKPVRALGRFKIPYFAVHRRNFKPLF